MCSSAACAPGTRSPPRSDLLTVELPDPIGSQFGVVVDEVTYGAELRDALHSMAERWDLPICACSSSRCRCRRRPAATSPNSGEFVEGYP
jgi:hypothetical protein